MCKSAVGVDAVTKDILKGYFEEKLEKFTNESSSFTIVKFIYFEMRVVEFTPLTHRIGHGKMVLPSILKNKKAVINVENSDNKCFVYAILSVLYYKPTENMHRMSYCQN